MSEAEKDLLVAFERHSVEAIRGALEAGADPLSPIRGKSPVTSLVEMYTRSTRFPDCLRLLLERGAVLDDPVVAPVLLDDAEALRTALAADPSLVGHRTTMECTFTPLVGASLLHVAAEYGSANAARVLLESGADVEARAAIDPLGLDGHTPLFHTVNSNANHGELVLRLLLEAGARSDVHLPGLTWGRGFEWETTVFDVTPVSYAQMGLLPQMHRRERDVYAVIRLLLEAAGREVPPLENVPNRYLLPKSAAPGA